MRPLEPDTVLQPVVLQEASLREISPRVPEGLEVRLLTEPDEWLATAYGLLSAEFEPDVLDPLPRYREWLEMNRSGTHPFPFLAMVAYVPSDGLAHCVGVISGNLMSVPTRPGEASPPAGAPFVFAIGHQQTSGLLRARGVRGVGTCLWKAASREARRRVAELGGSLRYSFVEAEGDSLGFWSRLGFRWPRGVQYWQPPLEFDAHGQFVHAEVPEIPMLCPVEDMPGDRIDRRFLEEMIATVYQNWSLAKYRTTLAPEALQRAEQYVMGDLFGRVRSRMPRRETIPLVEIRLGGTAGNRVRSIALSHGIQHGLEPLRGPRLGQIQDFDDMLRSMKHMALGARTLGEAADVLEAMATDPECRVVLTLSRAASVAKLDGILAEVLERGLAHCVVSTGAILVHGFNAERGSDQFKAPAEAADSWLYTQGYNRIHDAVETEYALDEFEDIVREILAAQPAERPLCSSDLVRALGEWLERHQRAGGFIHTAFRKDVPVFVPAFTDSELGLDFALHNHHCRREGKPELRFDPYLDFNRYVSIMSDAKARGVVTLGGGVPRHWAQQVGPYVDALERREEAVPTHLPRFKYGVRICPEPEQWGGRSGSTYSEGVSWGEFLPPDEGGRSAEVLSDYSLVVPLLMKGLFQRLDKRASAS